jgi:hypothetical protein
VVELVAAVLFVNLVSRTMNPENRLLKSCSPYSGVPTSPLGVFLYQGKASP